MSNSDLSSHPARRAGLSNERIERLLGLERAVRQTTGQSTMVSEAIARRFNLTSSDLECLDLVCAAEGTLSAGQLAEASGLSTGAITGVVDRLERAGYVTRERDPADRRRVVVRILPRVDEDIGPYYQEMQQGFFEICNAYSDDELALFEAFFRRCSRLGIDALARLQAAQAADAPSDEGAS